MLGAARGDSLQCHVHLQGVGTLDSEGLWLTMGLGLAVGITDLMAPSRLKVEPLSAIRGCPGVGDEPRAHLHISTSPLPYSGYGCGIEDTPLAAWCQSHFLYVLEATLPWPVTPVLSFLFHAAEHQNGEEILGAALSGPHPPPESGLCCDCKRPSQLLWSSRLARHAGYARQGWPGWAEGSQRGAR